MRGRPDQNFSMEGDVLADRPGAGMVRSTGDGLQTFLTSIPAGKNLADSSLERLMVGCWGDTGQSDHVFLLQLISGLGLIKIEH